MCRCAVKKLLTPLPFAQLKWFCKFFSTPFGGGWPRPPGACALTVAHVLLECNHYNVVRQRYFNVSSLHELFDTVNAQNILGFIRVLKYTLYMLGFIVSCKFTFIHLIDFITAIILNQL